VSRRIYGSIISDPLVALGFAAALSRSLRLATGIIILPQRHPFYVAKEFATLDVLSGGRAVMGVGIGWLEEEFDATRTSACLVS
jgi:alkanesulfonate monooxygenase SsuD/methylene tetrahydromethanopterin reductase-like flavin-dependent oxidoreductase (luciferase family)